jgi:hypothetical protein
MSATASNEINLDDQEVERIITDDEGDRTYLIEVTGTNPIRVDHNKRYALDGTTLSAGQTHTVSNLRGQELYAAAHAGQSSFRVRYAGADVQSQPEREVSVVGDVTLGSSVGVSSYTGSTIPVDPQATDPVTDTDSGTGSANAARVTLGSLRRRVDIHADTSGAATLTVEVSVDDQAWLEYETVEYSSATVEVEAFDVAFEYVRAYLDQNRNGITMSAKGQ